MAQNLAPISIGRPSETGDNFMNWESILETYAKFIFGLGISKSEELSPFFLTGLLRV